jgi:hypothetical protein
LPSGASCSFSPATVTPFGGVADTTLTVTTAATSASLHRSSYTLFEGSALAFALCCFGLKNQRRGPLSLLLALCVVGLALLDGCGASSSTPPSTRQSVTSIVTVVATSGPTQHTATFSLTVN